MARSAKNEKKLTIEEKLEQALVPEAEQPYPVPENWCWVRLSSLVTPSKDRTGVFTNSLTRYVGLEHMEKGGGIVSFGSAEGLKSQKNVFAAGQVLYGKLRPYLNKHDIAAFEGVCSTDILVFEVMKSTYSRFVNYYLDLPYFIEYAVSHSKGINLPRVSESVILNAAVPLPPLAEQRRIVDRIESLFSKLDAAKEKAQAVVDGFEDRKAAILHKAFTGELTAKWRHLNYKSDTRLQTTVAAICNELKYGTAKKSSPEGDVIVIRMGNLQNGEIDWANVVYSNDEEDNTKYRLVPSDVLFNRTNSADLVGKTSIYRGEYPAIYAGYLIKLDYDRKRIIGDYLNYMLNSPEAKEYCNSVKSDGVNQSNINAKKIGAFMFPLPSLDEQKVIIQLLDEAIKKETYIRDMVEQTVEKINTMKRSILARAFHSELGTNDSTDEAAVDLILKIER